MSRIILWVVLAASAMAVRAEASDPSTAEQATTAEHLSSQRRAVPKTLTGTVIETVNAAGYTYVHFDNGGQKIWAAAPEFEVAVGERMAVSDSMPMHDHYSKTLDRTFDLVYFVSRVEVDGVERRPARSTSNRPSWMRTDRRAADEAAQIDLAGIERAVGGKTIEELYAGKADLVGQAVVVRGRVVKFLSGIMGRNWLHLRDGTGAPGSDDLTVTTEATVETGDTVLVRGKVTADKDFGYGYKYELIIEDAEITVE